MKTKISILLIIGTLTGLASGRAQWTNISKGLNESNIQAVTVALENPDILYSGTSEEVYRSQDGGVTWKRVLGFKGAEEVVQVIFQDPSRPAQWYVGTDKGLEFSADGEKHWKKVFRGADEKSKSILSLARPPANARYIWIGTEEGVFLWDPERRSAEKLVSFPDVAVSSISGARDSIVVTTPGGIYKSVDGGAAWEKVYFHETSETADEEPSDASLEQFGVEEIPTGQYFSNLFYLPSRDRYFAATKNGVIAGSKDAAAWTPFSSGNLGNRKVNSVAGDADTFYAATDKGIFRWNWDLGRYEDISEGLGSLEIQSLAYSPYGDYLIAATKNGLYRYAHPEVTFAPSGTREFRPMTDPLRRFESEPSVYAVQAAAIRYAEVNPEKILAWRTAAARKAWLPTFSVTTHADRTNNIDIDRGGTGDPDKFIIGPQDRSTYWTAGVNWDLGELIWNNDQTSIDSRSRLMVQLRNDILSEVTHLYYERRRLQADLALSPPADPKTQVDKSLTLEELTAQLDALTGGYFSAALKKNQVDR